VLKNPINHGAFGEERENAHRAATGEPLPIRLLDPERLEIGEVLLPATRPLVPNERFSSQNLDPHVFDDGLDPVIPRIVERQTANSMRSQGMRPHDHESGSIAAQCPQDITKVLDHHASLGRCVRPGT
jgi:hypothetical protein